MQTIMKKLLVATLMMTSLVVSHRRDVIVFHQDTGRPHALQTDFRPEHRERGYVRNCNGGYYNVSWYPPKFSPADRIQFYAGLVAPVEIDEIHVVGVLWYEGAQIMKINKKMKCAEIAARLAAMFPRDDLRLNCPIPRGQMLSGSFLYTDTGAFIGADGTYKLEAKVKDLRGREVMCVNMKVEVLPFPGY